MSWAFSALKFVTGILSALYEWSSVFFAYILGRKSEKANQIKEAAEIKDEQLKAATRRPRGKRGLINRLLSGDF